MAKAAKKKPGPTKAAAKQAVPGAAAPKKGAGKKAAPKKRKAAMPLPVPQDIPADVVADVIAWVKSRDLVVETALTLAPTDTAGDALSLLPKRAHGAAIVLSDERPVGVVTEKDLTGVDRFVQVRDVMSSDLVTVRDDVDVVGAYDTLSGTRRRLAPVVRL